MEVREPRNPAREVPRAPLHGRRQVRTGEKKRVLLNEPSRSTKGSSTPITDDQSLGALQEPICPSASTLQCKYCPLQARLLKDV